METTSTEMPVTLAHHASPPAGASAYHWQVIYHDGGVIAEFDREEGRGWGEVDAGRGVKAVILSTAAGEATHVVEVPAGATPVFFRRRRAIFSLTEIESGPRAGETTHCIGWQHDAPAVSLALVEGAAERGGGETEDAHREGRPSAPASPALSAASYLFAFEDGSVLLTSNLQAV